MSNRLRAGLALLCLVFIACGAPPPPLPPSPPDNQVAVAGPTTEQPDEGAEADDDGDPGPIPITSADLRWGRRDAPVTVVVFGDYQCPFCARLEPTLAELQRNYGPDRLRIVWKHNPLPFHPQARPAAVFFTALHERLGHTRSMRVHDSLYLEQRRLEDAMADVAATAGTTLEELRASAAWTRAEAKVDADIALAKTSGVTGTPASFLNGVFLSGAQPYEKFAAIVDEQLVKAKELIQRGTPPRRVYAELTAKQKQAMPPPSPSRSKPAPDDRVVHRVPIGKSPVRGKSAALVTIVEFSEFQCPFCGRVAPTVAQILREYGDKVRLVWKHNPLPFHPRATPAAELTFVARAQKGDAGFWAAHDLLFGRECRGNPAAKDRAECEANNGTWLDNQQHLDDQDLAAYAKDLGVNAAKVQAAIDGKQHATEIFADQDLADDLQANGTPHFFINGRRLVGAQPIEKFRELIDEQLEIAKDLVKKGTPAAKVYDKIMATAVGPEPPEQKQVAAPTRANPSRGSAGAKVVVQMFSDFQCPFCKRVLPTLEELEKAYPGKVRVVWRNMPLPMHKDAVPAAEAAMEAFAQKGDAGFWAMYELLFAGQGGADPFTRQSLETYAAKVGLDMARFTNALDTGKHRAAIEADVKLASDAGISGTPAFVINGYFVSGAQPLAKFRRVVEIALGTRK